MWIYIDFSKATLHRSCFDQELRVAKEAERLLERQYRSAAEVSGDFAEFYQRQLRFIDAQIRNIRQRRELFAYTCDTLHGVSLEMDKFIAEMRHLLRKAGK